MKDHILNPKDFILDEIESIELVGEEPTVDITIEDTHMFFANDIYTHNSSHEADTIQAQNVADSYRKIMTGDFVFSLSRKMEDKQGSTARIHIIKNRFGPDGLTMPTYFNSSNGDIRIYDSASPEGIEIQQKFKDTEDTSKDAMRDQWNKMKKNKGFSDD